MLFWDWLLWKFPILLLLLFRDRCFNYQRYWFCWCCSSSSLATCWTTPTFSHSFVKEEWFWPGSPPLSFRTRLAPYWESWWFLQLSPTCRANFGSLWCCFLMRYWIFPANCAVDIWLWDVAFLLVRVRFQSGTWGRRWACEYRVSSCAKHHRKNQWILWRFWGCWGLQCLWRWDYRSFRFLLRCHSI